ncbi:MAG: prepilin peptidase [Deltaproteobacteria bacterium HGW-Deltaproteobacteria-4]|nr:MAG: prepilin peptidase [Deltaproteobacteria bacterium HGW-Deltaproteobacteria-4]
MSSIIVYLLVFSLGACIGSFLNVCIYRIPAGLSIVHPPSRCPQCGTQIRWWQNIPIVSWLFLRGKCATCKVKISTRYLLVEILTGLLFLKIFMMFAIHPATLVFWAFAAALVILTFIDLDHQIIPDVISLPGVILGFSTVALTPLTWSDSILGILLGGGSLWLIAIIYEFLTKNEGMGGGDIKLLAMIGAFLGWKAILPVIFISSCLGTLVGVPLMLRQGASGKLAIPFGPFLSAAALIWFFYGGLLLRWYLGFFRYG